MSSEPIASHGRGGAGNITPDTNVYVDGEIVREGPVGDQGDGTFSSGRGGVGNMQSPHLKATTDKPAGDVDVIPETAMRKSAEYENYHTGRGGGGNVHTDHEKHKEGLVEKLKSHLRDGKKDGSA